MALPEPGVNDAVSLSSGDSYTCALKRTGAVACWGSLFQADLPGVSFGLAPFIVPELDQVIQVSVGSSTACALRRNGTVACWGEGTFGQLGTGTFNSNTTPQVVRNLDNVVLLADASTAGGRHVCVLRSDRSVACWGERTDSTTPVVVDDLPD